MATLAAAFVADGSAFYGFDLMYRVMFAMSSIAFPLAAIREPKFGASASLVVGLYGLFLTLATMAPGEIQEVGAIYSAPPTSPRI